MARKRRNRKTADSGQPANKGGTFRGGQTMSAVVLERAQMNLDAALDQLIRYFADFQTRALLPTDTARASDVARALTADVNRAARSADLARRAVRSVFDTDLKSIESLRERTRATRQFAANDEWCALRITEMRKGLLTAIRRAQYWNKRLRRPSAGLFPKLPPLPHLSLEQVWEDLQYHNIGGVTVPVRKVKFNLKFLGRKLNFAIVSFPEFPGWKPKPKILVSSGEEAFNGTGLHALDTIGPKVGNHVLPGGATGPAVDFSGYMKIIYTDGIPPGCRVEYRTVLYPSWSFLPSGGTWRDATPGGNPGGPRADPPGGGPSYSVAPGTAAFADFPGSWFLPGTAVCSYLVRNDLFRTWVVQICPGNTLLLGYWEWRFRFVLHQGTSGVENITTQPGNGPAGVADPPGGWPAAPSSGPTTFVPAGSAPAQATTDYNNAFP